MTRRTPRPPGRETVFSGRDVLNHPALNKGTAFTEEERDALGIRGLLPPKVFTLEEQAGRILKNFRGKSSDLERYIFLQALQDRNETLFYRVVMDHVEEMMPIIYTPTVGEAVKQFAHIFRRARGLYITLRDRGRVRQVLRNWQAGRVGVIVVTDGERILGLGDLGANGMGIPIGKLALYTAAAGIPPALGLPVLLDVGTDNERLLDDPLYLGLPQRRERGDAYDALVEEFVTEVQAVFPGALIQFEDFVTPNAFRLLRRYRDRACVFNDDIQGTAAVALAGLVAATRITGQPLRDQRILFVGAGSANTGIADLTVQALVGDGLTEVEARHRCWFVDRDGLLVRQRSDISEFTQPYAHEADPLTDLASIVDRLKPTALIGATGSPGTFSRAVVRTMADANERPIIFALSNPTSKAECTAAQAYEWSEGRVVFASGSPFAPVTYGGRRFVPGQGNNAYVFPGVGLGVIATQAARVTDAMFLAAAEALASHVTEASLAQGSIYPPLSQIREASLSIALAVARMAYDQGLAGLAPPDDLRHHIRTQMYEPAYPHYT